MLIGIEISHPIRGINATTIEMIVISKIANKTYKNPMIYARLNSKLVILFKEKAIAKFLLFAYTKIGAGMT